MKRPTADRYSLAGSGKRSTSGTGGSVGGAGMNHGHWVGDDVGDGVAVGGGASCGGAWGTGVAGAGEAVGVGTTGPPGGSVGGEFVDPAGCPAPPDAGWAGRGNAATCPSVSRTWVGDGEAPGEGEAVAAGFGVLPDFAISGVWRLAAGVGTGVERAASPPDDV
jgi:hypothetical protein